MRIGIIGINHKSADLRLREKLAKVAEHLFGPDHSAYLLFSYVLLSTCNRTEIYFQSDDLSETHTYLLNSIRERIEEEFEHRIYSYFGTDCFFHLAKVTAGFDSAIIGEAEIQGQVKRAYEMAHAYRSLASELHFLFQKCLKIGKNVRSNNSFSHALPSLEEAILNVSFRVLGNFCEKKILFVGLSEINQKIFLRFKKLGCQNIFICNRSSEKALEVSEKEGVGFIPWQKLDKWIFFDLAIFGTKCPNFLVFPQDPKKDINSKLIIDLCVPRNVDPKVGRHPGLTLLNVDQLNKEIDRKRKHKALEMARIETGFITTAVEKQAAIFKLREFQQSLLNQNSA